MDRWAGKVAVVTGASAGIGAAIIKQLVRHGMIVAGLARRVDKMKELAESLQDCAGKLHAVECDVSKEESVVAAFSWVQENLGSVNVLVNNAGMTKECSLIDGSLEDWQAVFDVNVLGLCLCTREAVRMMRENGDEGVVINMSSLAGERVPFIPGFSVYPASKRTIAALAQTLRHELTGGRIRVTGISPGLVATELMASYSTYSEEALASFPTLDPEDVASAAVFILSCGSHVVVQDIVLRPLGESCASKLHREEDGLNLYRATMEIIDLSQKRKAFAPPEKRYQNPYQEAMKLRPLWTHYKPLGRSREMQMAKSLYMQALKKVDKEEELGSVSRLIKKGLLLDPRSHGFYALKGCIYSRQGKWTEAIKNYEIARTMTKFDGRLSLTQANIMYNNQLAECYTSRGNCYYYESNTLLEALSDFEQVLVLQVKTKGGPSVQDNLLEILRKLDKYRVFRRYWEEFVVEVSPQRASALLTQHAEYKIYLREMATARQMLYEALELDKDNVPAQQLLQVIFNTGHALTSHSILWCMHGCFDKALVAIVKALDCNPYNPGFTLIKTVVLRLSGRLEEANAWLEHVSKNFYKFLEPSRDVQLSIMGKLTKDETRNELIKQWYLIRYDMATRCMLKDKLEAAARIIYGSNLPKYFAESYVLLGDSFFRRENYDLALESYLKYRERERELGLPASRKTIDVTQRIVDILNERAKTAAHKGHSRDAIRITNEVLRILDEDQIGPSKLGLQRGHALLYKTRGLFRQATKAKRKSKECCQTGSKSLQFVREPNDGGLYRSLYGDRNTEDVIDRFAPKSKLPQSLKIMMQYS